MNEPRRATTPGNRDQRWADARECAGQRRPGLLAKGDVNPAALAEAGFRLAGLEVPIVGPDGRVVVDVVLFHADRGHLILLEAKSGANVAVGKRDATRRWTRSP